MKIHEYNEMMAYLTRPGVDPSSEQQVAGLSESFPGTYTSYQDAVYDGFQGTREEWLQQQSIPQSDRPFTGKIGGLVEPGVTHYATRTRSPHLINQDYIDALNLKDNIKKGDELGKSVKQILSKKNK